MTRDEILVMKPGRELDTLVMRIVFKAEKKDVGDECYWLSEFDGEEVCWPRWFSPSTDIAAAFEVWEHDHPDTWELHLSKIGKKYLARIFERRFNDVPSHKELAQVESESAVEAMVKCRLLALMGEDETHD